MSPGQQAYEVFGDALKWEIDGAPLPVWQRLPAHLQAAWEAVAKASKADAVAAMLRKPSDSQRSNR